MSKMELALSLDNTPVWVGYDNGAAHMIMSGVITLGGDHIGGASETMPIVCANGKTLETARVSLRDSSDKRCKRCESWVKSTGAEDAIQSALEAASAQENGPSVADMIREDPNAVIIGLDTVAEAPVKAEKPVKAKKAAKTDKPVGEVRCIPNAPGLENGDGSGVCRACSWRGPMKAFGEDGEMRMTAHWVAGRAPKSEGLTEVKVGSEAPAAPATVDSAHRGADDLIGGAAAGMMSGRTSLTRGKAMDADKVTGPKERGTHKVTGESLPTSTTMDSPLGRERTDTRSVEIPTVGGRHGFLTQEEYGNLSRTQQRRYRRQVETNKARATRAGKLSKTRAADTRTRAERMSG
jgi:hypothetical protein